MTVDYDSPVDVMALLALIAAPLGGMTVKSGTTTFNVAQTDTPVSVTFPDGGFSDAPLVFVDVMPLGLAGQLTDVRWGSVAGSSSGTGTPTGFVFQARRNTGAAAPVRINWIAIGPA